MLTFFNESPEKKILVLRDFAFRRSHRQKMCISRHWFYTSALSLPQVLQV